MFPLRSSVASAGHAGLSASPPGVRISAAVIRILLILTLLFGGQAASAAAGNFGEKESASEDPSERLLLHMKVFQNWMRTGCQLTPEQQQRLQRVCMAEIDAQRLSQPKRLPSTTSGRLPEDSLLEFAGLSPAGDCTSRSLLQFQIVGLLSAEQSSTLDALEQERQQWLAAAERQYLIATIDEKLRLTEDQWLLLDDQIRRNPVSSGLFSFDPEDSPLTYLSHLSVGNRIGVVRLSAEQQQRCVQLQLPGVAFRDARVLAREARGLPRPNPHVGIRLTGFSDEEIEQGLNLALRELRTEFDQAVEHHVTIYQRAWRLSSPQVAQLKLAGTGATIRCLAEWKTDAADMLKNQPAANQAVKQRLLAPDVKPPELIINHSPPLIAAVFDHPIWTKTLAGIRPTAAPAPDSTSAGSSDTADKVAPDPEAPDPDAADEHQDPWFRQRSSRRRQAVIDWVVVSLDRELWLRPAQRERVRQVVAMQLPHRITRMTAPARELVFLARSLDGFAASDRDSLLDADQQTVVQLLKQQFQSTSNSVKIQKNDGTWHSVSHP